MDRDRDSCVIHAKGLVTRPTTAPRNNRIETPITGLVIIPETMAMATAIIITAAEEGVVEAETPPVTITPLMAPAPVTTPIQIRETPAAIAATSAEKGIEREAVEEEGEAKQQHMKVVML